jgi:hypothetical protein
MFMFRLQTTGYDYCINIVNKFFENVAKFKHFTMMVTNKNCVQEKINNNACSSESFVFLSAFKNIKIKMYPLFCMGMKPGFVLREK